jgi:hypothetical protein
MQGDRQHDVTKTFPSKIVSESFLCPFLSRGGVPCAKIEVEKSKELTPLFLSSAAGAFTAPVRGVYYIRFIAAQHGLGYMGISMFKNGQATMSNYHYNSHGYWVYLSNGVILELEEGDVVYMRLPASFRLYDDT